MTTKKWPRPPMVEVPVYGGIIHLITEREVYAQCLDWLGSESKMYQTAIGCCQLLEDAKNCSAILIGLFQKSYVTLAHELNHATFFILDRAGVPVVAGAPNEAFCYLHGELFKLCLRKLKWPNML